jgi:hypothetical protein
VTVIDTYLNKIRNYLLEKYAPEAIFLHGSRVRGDAADTSDYDIVMITSDANDIFSHDFEGMMLDIAAYPLNTHILEVGNKVPNWPLKILHDTNDIGKRIYEETELAYKNGPTLLSEQEWKNRINYTERLIDKIKARGNNVSIRRYYLSDFYMRAVRYWFEKKNRWTVSPYRALPLIQAEDPDFFIELQNLWTDSYLSALYKINEILFD